MKSPPGTTTVEKKFIAALNTTIELHVWELKFDDVNKFVAYVYLNDNPISVGNPWDDRLDACAEGYQMYSNICDTYDPGKQRY